MASAVFLRAVLALLIVSPAPVVGQSMPTEVWAQRYSGPPSSGQDQAYRVARDKNGDIVVFGTTFDRNGSSDFVTIKYSGADGSVLWLRRYDSPKNLDEHIGGLAVDAAGDVFITGSSGQTGTEWDMYTAKYAGTNGRLLWEKMYTGPGNFTDHAAAIVVDSRESVLIAGHSGRTNGTDLYFASYANTNGALIWDRHHTNGVPGGILEPTAMVLDPAGDIFVTGHSDLDLHAAKYSGTDGRLLWEVRRDAGEHGKGLLLLADNAGDLIVAGYFFDFSSLHDIYLAKYRASDGAVLWERQYNGPENGDDLASGVAVDQGGNIFLGGSSDTNLLVAKYTGDNGKLLWEQRVPGKANLGLQVNSLAMDQNSDLLVAATVQNAFTAKYSGATGSVIWEKRSAPGSSIFSNALILAPNGDAFVTGSADNDFYTVKYAALDGGTLWEKTHNEPAKGVDIPRATAVDAEGNVIVFGSSNQELYTAKYAKSDGHLLWERRYPQEGVALGDSAAMILDRDGSVIISGKGPLEQNTAPLRRVYLAKYASSNGAIIWEKLIASSSPRGTGLSGLALDENNNVLVTGSKGDVFGGSDMYTAKLSATDGSLLWERSYTSSGWYYDQAHALAVDSAGDAIVTGTLKNAVAPERYTAKYAAEDGRLLWEQRLTNSTSFRSVLSDPRGALIASGIRNRGLHLAKFDADTGALLWERNDTNGIVSAGPFVAVDSSGNTFAAFLRDIPIDTIPFSLRMIVLQKYSSNGTLLWEQPYWRDSEERPSLTLMTLDSMENLLLVGALRNEFGIAKHTFMVRFAAADGAILWEIEKSDYVASAVGFNPHGAFAVAGSTDVDFVTLLFREDLPILRATRNGEALELSWPVTYSSWRLESQSGALGLRAGAAWNPVAQSPGTNSATLPVDLSTKATFFRLVRP